MFLHPFQSKVGFDGQVVGRRGHKVCDLAALCHKLETVASLFTRKNYTIAFRSFNKKSVD